MRSILLWTSIIELISLSGICRFLRTFSTFTFWFTVSGWLMSLTWTSKSWKIRTNKRSVNKPAAHWNFGNFATYWMFDIFQGSGEGINELVRQLGQETNSVHIQDCHVIRQLACMDCDIQGGEKLVFGLKTAVTSQGFNQSCFSCTDLKKKTNNNYNSCLLKRSPEFSTPSPSLTTVGISQHGDDRELLMFTLSSKKVPLPAQFFNCCPNLHLTFLQQSLLDLQQGLTCKDQLSTFTQILT